MLRAMSEIFSLETGMAPERRSRTRLRQIFVEAYAVAAPFFDEANTWLGHGHQHLAYRAVHEHFPGLTGDEVFIIVEAAQRIFEADGKPVDPI